MLAAVGWQDEQTCEHAFIGGISLVVSAPIDALYAAVDLAEWAYAAAVGDAEDFDAAAQRLRNDIAEEAFPPLLALQAEAARRDIAFLWDDDIVSVGLGKGSETWPARELPSEFDWSNKHNIPVGLVTGTNGKTTTVRLATHIVRSAGLSVGLSSTDWVGVNDQILERGDFSGPGGARTALRQPSIDLAVLETARGGLLRRGLGPQRADAAVITNIAEDHLGDFGSQDMTELLNLKWIVMQSLDERSTAILNADDPLLVQKSAELAVPIVWFSPNPESAHMQERITAGQNLLSVVDGSLSRFDGEHWQALCDVNDIPITLGGIARHNVANALAAVGLCQALGISDAAIVAGLQSMTENENPGRCNLFRIGGVEVLVDFAHNPEAMAAIFDIAQQRPAKRRALCFGQAGDRTDSLIRELAQSAWSIGLDKVIVSELADYYRGRERGEVFALIRKALLEFGASDEQISHNETELESLHEALAWAEDGDIIIFIALADSVKLLQTVRELAES